MTAIHFILDAYFAAILGVAGISKIREPAQFAMALRQQRLLPHWSIVRVSSVFPWAEVVLASVLIVGIGNVISATLVTALFGGFLIIKVILVTTKSTTGCGCYGHATANRVDSADLITSTALLCLAILHLWSAKTAAPAMWTWRLSAIVVFFAVGCWLLRFEIGRRWRSTRTVVA